LDPIHNSSSLRNVARRVQSPRYIQFVHRNLDRMHALIQAAKKEPAVRAAVAKSKEPGTTPKVWFSGVDDETWLWMNTFARRRRRAIANLLPQVPPPSFQENFTGHSGDSTLREGFNAYRIIKSSYERYIGPIGSCTAIMDFGCGWGRIIRFFLKDVDPEKLLGVDHFDGAVQVCRETNKWSRFSMIEPLPPTKFPEKSFDLIYLYSVFSHLPEEMHLLWLREFRRLLRPGGILIATTRRRDFIQWCEGLRHDPQLSERPDWMRQSAMAFVDVDAALSDYDNGQFCYASLGKTGGWSFWGEACIPRPYAEKNWNNIFEFCEYIDDLDICPQNVIVARRPS
jgi:SAM-dependent methyltransferase